MTCNCDNDGSNEYIIELNQQGAPGIKGEQGEQGYSPIVDYTSDNNALQLHIVNEQNTVTTPEIPLKSYTDSQLAGKLNKDGSNADNGISLRGVRFSNTSTVSVMRSDNDINIVSGSDKDIHLYPQGSGKLYYGATSSSSDEVATIGDIPTVGNGTITLTQDGVTKGTFTTNQSGNTTIDLDSGVTNPLVVQNSNSDGYAEVYGQGAYAFDTSSGGVFATQWTETVDDVEHTYTRKLSLSNGGRYRTKPYIQYEYKDEVGGSGTGSISDLGFLNVGGGTFAPLSIGSFGGGYKYILNYNTDTLGLDADSKLTVKEMTGSDSITAGAAGLVPAPSAGDQDKFLKGDGTWDTVGGGGSSYTAGTGIDITNDVISIDTSVVAQLSDIPDVSNFVTSSDLSTTLASYVQSSSLGTAAYTASTDYATAAQGGKADTAMQPSSNDSITGTKEFTTGTAQFDNGSKLEVRGQSTLFLRGNSVANGAYLGLGLRGTDSTNNVTINQMYFTANNNSDIATLRLDGLNLSKSPYIYNGYTRLGQITVTNSNINFTTGTGTALQYNGNEVATVNDIPDVSELEEKFTVGNGLEMLQAGAEIQPAVVIPYTISSSYTGVEFYNNLTSGETKTAVIKLPSTGNWVQYYIGNASRRGIQVNPVDDNIWLGDGQSGNTNNSYSFTKGTDNYLKIISYDGGATDVFYSHDNSTWTLLMPRDRAGQTIGFGTEVGIYTESIDYSITFDYFKLYYGATLENTLQVDQSLLNLITVINGGNANA